MVVVEWVLAANGGLALLAKRRYGTHSHIRFGYGGGSGLEDYHYPVVFEKSAEVLAFIVAGGRPPPLWDPDITCLRWPGVHYEPHRALLLSAIFYFCKRQALSRWE